MESILRGRGLHWRWFGAAVLLVISAGAVLAVASTGGASTPERASSSPAPRPPQPCGSACTASVIAAARSNFPPAQPIKSGTPGFSEAQALAKARSLASDPTGTQRLDPASQAALPATAWQTTMEQFAATNHVGQDPLIAPARPIWVVVVHGYMEPDLRPGEAAVVDDVYTEVLDAATGYEIMIMIGRAANSA